MAGAFWGTRVLEIVKKHDSGGLVWKRIKLTTTRKANAKKRLLRVWQGLGEEPFDIRSSNLTSAAAFSDNKPWTLDTVTAEGWYHSEVFEGSHLYDISWRSYGRIVKDFCPVSLPIPCFSKIIVDQLKKELCNEAVLKACSEPPPPKSSGDGISQVEKKE
ncbi:hypothetical protein SDJN02_11716 [Cucurbita argyrosperma subsp. argyrosperma]|nr:hypothetical protein SDJN02_11716 [Cucurbita argyrosperma subsp. argyrosperma]